MPDTTRQPWLERWQSETGQDLVEYTLLLVFTTAILVVGVVALWRWDLFQNATIVTIIGAILAGLAWSAKNTIAALTRHAQLEILEALNADGPLRRAEIKARFRGRYRPLRWFVIDALVNLVDSGRVDVQKDGKYAVVDNPSGDSVTAR